MHINMVLFIDAIFMKFKTFCYLEITTYKLFAFLAEIKAFRNFVKHGCVVNTKDETEILTLIHGLSLVLG